MNNEARKVLTIRDLAQAYNHKEYKLLINGFPKYTRQYLTRNNSDRRLFQQNIHFCQEQVAIIESVLKDHESSLDKAIQEFKQTDKELENARKELLAAELALSAAYKSVSDAKEKYKNISYNYQQIKNNISKERSMIDTYTSTFESANKVLREAKHYIVVHSTATVSALSKKINTGVLVCSQYDASTLLYKKHVDKVVHCIDDYSDLIPDDAEKYFTSEEEYTSAQAYINLVLKFLFEGKDYELLYNSAGIKYILDSII